MLRFIRATSIEKAHRHPGDSVAIPALRMREILSCQDFVLLQKLKVRFLFSDWTEIQQNIWIWIKTSTKPAVCTEQSGQNQ